MQHVSAAVTDADVLLVVTDIFQEQLLESAADHEGFLRKLVETECPIIVAVNKIDLIDDASTTIEEVTQRWTTMLPGAEVVLISALEVPPPRPPPAQPAADRARTHACFLRVRIAQPKGPSTLTPRVRCRRSCSDFTSDPSWRSSQRASLRARPCTRRITSPTSRSGSSPLKSYGSRSSRHTPRKYLTPAKSSSRRSKTRRRS